jgi:serine/threonine-protein kinase
VSELLLRWEELHDRGTEARAEDLCPDAPELWPPLRQAIDELLRMQAVLDTAGPSGSESTETDLALPPLPELPGYDLLDTIGHGGMGVVYRAYERSSGREVAVKMLRGVALPDAPDARRFAAEAHVLARLDHPHIVPVYATGTHGGQPYFSMKYMKGGSLTRHLARFGADPRAAAGLVEKVAGAVHYLHGRKVLHRDLKPLNILLDERDEPCVSDFGLVKLLDADGKLTRTGAVLGTLPYMAPEQAAGCSEELSPATDVWALGVILYELVAGRRPFAASRRTELAGLIATADPPPMRATSDAALETIVRKCLAKSPAQRYASADELATDLARWRCGESVAVPQPSWLTRLGRKFRKR